MIVHDLDIARGWIDMADPRLGTEVVHANDDFFADKARLIQRGEPVFIPGKYDDHGKWMDGWESRRRRVPGHDHCVIRLGKPGLIRGFEIDTRFFTGNYPPGASIDVCVSDQRLPPDEAWQELVPQLALQGDSRLAVPAHTDKPVTHVRLHIYPDGGVARLRIYGQVAAQFEPGVEVDLAAMVNGALPVTANNEHFGKVSFMLQPGKSVNMGDGWETRRRREPGHDWAIVKLAATGTIDRFLVDTNHFKGNYPDRCSIQGAPEDANLESAGNWPLLLPEQKLAADKEHVFAKEIMAHAPVRWLRLNIFPDGGIARLRAFGKVAKR
jgi:allantoicase